jgi:hypothetical protein
MSKETLVFVLGVFVFFVPFLGVPGEWKEWFLIGAGILLMIAGYSLRRNAFFQSLEQEGGERRADVFVESSVVTTPQPVDEPERT